MSVQVITGNHAAGFALSAAGEANRTARGVACGIYPITPQTEIPEYLVKRLPEVDGVFVQAESEVGQGISREGVAAEIRFQPFQPPIMFSSVAFARCESVSIRPCRRADPGRLAHCTERAQGERALTEPHQRPPP